jgi:transposase InsO family protein
MDLVGPARVCSAGGKWYVLVIVDDYSRYAWVFFLADKGETFSFVRDLMLRLKNERHGDAVRAIRSDNGGEFKNSHFETFFELFLSVFRARIVPLILRCLGSNLLVGIMDSCLVHLCA